jgi:hypothetical protein
MFVLNNAAMLLRSGAVCPVCRCTYSLRAKNVEEDAGKALASAPSTLLSGELLPDIEGLDLLYKPSMGEMSALALPENLPLDFIASTLRYVPSDLICLFVCVIFWVMYASYFVPLLHFSVWYCTLLLCILYVLLYAV